MAQRQGLGTAGQGDALAAVTPHPCSVSPRSGAKGQSLGTALAPGTAPLCSMVHLCPPTPTPGGSRPWDTPRGHHGWVSAVPTVPHIVPPPRVGTQSPADTTPRSAAPQHGVTPQKLSCGSIPVSHGADWGRAMTTSSPPRTSNSSPPPATRNPTNHPIPLFPTAPINPLRPTPASLTLLLLALSPP